MFFNSNSLEICSHGFNWQFRSDNGVAPQRCQAIIWTSDVLVWWCIYASLSHNQLTHWPLGDLNKILDEVNFKLFSVTNGWGISCKIALRWMLLDLTGDKSTLVQVMAWCPQATNHYLSQCWPRFMSPYDVTRPQWVNKTQLYQQLVHCVVASNFNSRNWWIKQIWY